MFEYNAVVLRVVDGDTLHARVDLGFDLRADMTLRLAGINAPEIATPEGKAARDWLETRLFGSPPGIIGVPVTLRTIKDRKEKYGRFLAVLFGKPPISGVSINDLMVEAGHAVPYDGRGPRP